MTTGVAAAGRAAASSLPRFMVPMLGVTAGIQTLDPMISTVALVPASKTLGFSAATLALASGISTLALVATVIPTGLLADRLGRRRVLMAALAVAALGDVIAALSTDQWMFLIGRAVAGVGLGAVFGAAFAFVAAVGSERLGAALGLFGAMVGITTLGGAFLGGVLASVNWRIAFGIVPVLCVITCVLAPRFTPVAPRVADHKPDIPGMVLLAVGTVGILFGISNASASLVAPRTWAPVVIGVAALGVFTVVENRSRFPAFPVGLFRSPVFLAATFAGLAWNGAQSVVVLQLSNLWQYVEHYSTLAVSVGDLPFSILAIGGAVLAGRRLGRGTAPRHVLAVAFGCMVVGFGTLGLIRADSGYVAFLPALVLIGAGTAGASVPQGQLYMSQAPPEHFGPVTSSRLTSGQFGYALGLAGSSVLVSSLTFKGVTSRLLAAGVPPSQVGEGLDAITSFVNTGQEPGTAGGRLALSGAKVSYLHAFNTTMLVVAALIVIAGAVSLVLLRPARTASPATTAAPHWRLIHRRPRGTSGLGG